MTLYTEYSDYLEKRSGKDRRASMTQEEIIGLVETILNKTQRRQCGEHSGMVVWIKVGCGLLTLALGVLSWSTFIAAPEVKAALDRQNAANEKRFYSLERDVSDLKLVDIKIITQRNLDHNNKEKLQ